MVKGGTEEQSGQRPRGKRKMAVLGEKGNPLMRSGKWKEVGDGELDWILRVLGRHGRVLTGM